MIRYRLNGRGVVQCVVLLAVGAPLLAFGGMAASDDLRLQRTGVVTPAEVYDWRTSRSRGGVQHEIRYTFTVPGRPERFSRADPGLGREDLWSSVWPEEWERSRQTRHVEVRYVPADPRINYPVALAENPWFDTLAAASVGGIALAWVVGMIVVGGVQYLRCRRSPPLAFREYPLFRAERVTGDEVRYVGYGDPI
ncbi:DUF3592 domain-containing protein [Limnoglobus roseus]|uniref:DUF3592 domain-containing protein n=1 Tax=Limnoglobus roseus TaxID=2598579 RepID=A0A5C1AKR5_9BACT|nr:DUF3592 domain-containing protein [Limnoglobus roseus]QEL17458.1 hypothetical protein PX52LOC_04447 [Limnoglobus roseus]